MKLIPAFLHTVLLSFATFVSAQSDTAHHRAVYDAINKAQPSLQKVTATHKDDPTEFALTGWLQDGEVKKIVSLCSDEGSGPEEIYLEDEKPLFVFSTWYKTTDSGKRGAKVEERLYFKDGEVFKWLTTEKPAPVFHGEDYQATTERILTNTKAFVAALKKGKTAAKVKGADKVVEGTFTGIEQGDYFHWNMTSKSGKEMSFFILRAEDSVKKVVDNPESYISKKCRVTWKTSTEKIPEAGGTLEVDQVLSVEWLANK